jgi:Holliday junction resolvase
MGPDKEGCPGGEMTNYARGANFERQVKADLEGKGYLVIRAAGSHGIMDLVAFQSQWNLEEGDAGHIWFVQCKTNAKMLPMERKKLFEVSDKCGAWPILASRPKRGKIIYQTYFDDAGGELALAEIEP